MPTTEPPVVDADDRDTLPRHWTGAAGFAPWPARATALISPLARRAAAHDEAGDFVHDGFALLKQQGFLGMLVPRELGGGGASHAEACAVLSELAHGCPATALTLSMHTHLVAAQVWRHRRGLPAPVLERVARDGLVLVSTGASDWINSSGTVRRVDGGYRVSGRKMPASGAPAGELVSTSFRWDGSPDGSVVLHLVLPFAAEGLRVEETWDTMGMRATGSHTIVFDDVFVPEQAVALTRPAGEWHPVWSVVVGAALPLIMACYVGTAEAAAQRALDLAARRGDRPETATLAGRMLNQLTLARDVVRAMIDSSRDLQFDNTLDHASVTLARKTIAADAAIATVRSAMELGGGAAFAVAGGIERLYRDVHGALYHPLPAAQQERFSGRHALGLDPVSDIG